MESSDYIQILFGAGIGLLVTLSLQILNFVIKRRQANKLLNLEHPQINQFLSNYVKSFEMGYKVISRTPIPTLESISNYDQLLSLSSAKRRLTHNILANIKQAENLRILATPLLEKDKKEIELDVYGKLYFDYLIAAKKDSDELLKLT